jgi:hypothetical protein
MSGEAQGKEEKALAVARKSLNNGFTVEAVAEYAELDVENIRASRMEGGRLVDERCAGGGYVHRGISLIATTRNILF